MCGRYSVLTESEIIEIREILKEVFSPDIAIAPLNGPVRAENRERSNAFSATDEVRPTDHAPVIISQGKGVVSFQDLRWGFRHWDGKGKPIINARVETLATKNMFAPLLTVGRCVVPTAEYYEWKAEGRKKVKHFISDKEGNLLFMAGLYRDTEDGREFVIITKDAQDDIREIHDRMPVILQTSQIEDWLSGKLSPDDIVKHKFNAAIALCDGELDQLTLDIGE